MGDGILVGVADGVGAELELGIFTWPRISPSKWLEE